MNDEMSPASPRTASEVRVGISEKVVRPTDAADCVLGDLSEKEEIFPRSVESKTYSRVFKFTNRWRFTPIFPPTAFPPPRTDFPPIPGRFFRPPGPPRWLIVPMGIFSRSSFLVFYVGEKGRGG